MRSASRQKRILLDTNILRAYMNQDDSEHQAVVKRILALRAANYELCIAPQCLYELWVVLTRPVEQNGLGRSPEEADEACNQLRQDFTLLPDPADLVDEWQRLCRTYSVHGRRAHDVRLVAWMVRHQINEILTMNPDDFQLFSNLISALYQDNPSAWMLLLASTLWVVLLVYMVLVMMWSALSGTIAHPVGASSQFASALMWSIGTLNDWVYNSAPFWLFMVLHRRLFFG
ncbi:MAG: type II toxin-antitoxin system VapC family toxin [Armatimonadota bacterium]